MTGSDADGPSGDSVEGPATGVRYGPAPGTPCSLCATGLRGEDDLVIQYYGRDGGTGERGDGGTDSEAASGEQADATGPVAERSCRGACPECAAEVAELVEAWTSTARPPVDGDRSIAAGYRAIAGSCSFCERAVDDGEPTGIEYYRAGDRYEDGLGVHRHYVLCPHCVDVFEQFLADVATDAPSTDQNPPV